MSKDNRGTFRPSKDLVDFIKDYLKSEEAKKLGFTTPSSLLDHLTKNFVIKNRHIKPLSKIKDEEVYVEEFPNHLLVKIKGEEVKLIVQHIATGENILICTKCQERDCVFRNYVLSAKKFNSFLREHDLKVKRKRYTENDIEDNKRR